MFISIPHDKMKHEILGVSEDNEAKCVQSFEEDVDLIYESSYNSD